MTFAEKLLSSFYYNFLCFSSAVLHIIGFFGACHELRGFLPLLHCTYFSWKHSWIMLTDLVLSFDSNFLYIFAKQNKTIISKLLLNDYSKWFVIEKFIYECRSTAWIEIHKYTWFLSAALSSFLISVFRICSSLGRPRGFHLSCGTECSIPLFALLWKVRCSD